MACPSWLEEAPIVIDDTNEEDQIGVVIPNLRITILDNIVMDIIEEILKHNKYMHQLLWEQKIKALKEFQLKTIIDLLLIRSKNKVDECVNIEIVKVLLINWDGFNAYFCDMKNPDKILYNALLRYLKKNIKTVRKIFFSKLINKNKKEFEECIVIESSLKHLKTLFNPRFGIYDGEIYDLYFQDITKQEFQYTPPNFANWPHTAVKLSINGFEMLHENYNHNEFNMVNIDKESFKPEIKQSTNSDLHFLPSKCDTYIQSQSIIKYISNLQEHICNKNGANLPGNKKIEMETFLSECRFDILNAVNDVGVGVSYFINLNSYPYVRYTDNSNHSENRNGLMHGMNIRLQQIVYPAVKFCVSKIPVLDNVKSFTKEDFVNSLTYCCTICKPKFETSDFSEFTKHVINAHGTEAGYYICVRCYKSFPLKFLSQNRWVHECVQKT